MPEDCASRRCAMQRPKRFASTTHWAKEDSVSQSPVLWMRHEWLAAAAAHATRTMPPTQAPNECKSETTKCDPSGKDTDCASRRCAMQRPKRFASTTHWAKEDSVSQTLQINTRLPMPERDFQGGQRPTPMGFLPETMGKTVYCHKERRGAVHRPSLRATLTVDR
jgi:hypothetical protein